MTRDEILNLKVGDLLQNTFDIEAFTEFKKLKPNARWGSPRRIVEITYRGTNVHGSAYVGGYTEHGPNGCISFSISEDEKNYRIVTP